MIVALYIDLGIADNDYSKKGLNVCRENCERLDIELVNYTIQNTRCDRRLGLSD
ncbi:MAG: hypothetical protein ACE5OY_06980 [Candidatus Bathyarchaeia archaeon]